MVKRAISYYYCLLLVTLVAVIKSKPIDCCVGEKSGNCKKIFNANKCRYAASKCKWTCNGIENVLTGSSLPTIIKPLESSLKKQEKILGSFKKYLHENIVSDAFHFHAKTTKSKLDTHKLLTYNFEDKGTVTVLELTEKLNHQLNILEMVEAKRYSKLGQTKPVAGGKKKIDSVTTMGAKHTETRIKALPIAPRPRRLLNYSNNSSNYEKRRLFDYRAPSNPNLYPFKALGMLMGVLTDENKNIDLIQGAGSVIAANEHWVFVLTAAHNVFYHPTKNFIKNIRFFYRLNVENKEMYNKIDEPTFSTTDIERVYIPLHFVGGKYINYKDFQTDFAVIQFRNSAKKHISFSPLILKQCDINNFAGSGHRALLATYDHSDDSSKYYKMKEIRKHFNLVWHKHSDFVHIVTSVEPFDVSITDLIKLPYYTTKGMSGSPIVLVGGDNNKQIAIHVGVTDPGTKEMSSVHKLIDATVRIFIDGIVKENLQENLQFSVPGIHFVEHHSESKYRAEAQDILERLKLYDDVVGRIEDDDDTNEFISGLLGSLARDDYNNMLDDVYYDDKNFINNQSMMYLAMFLSVSLLLMCYGIGCFTGIILEFLRKKYKNTYPQNNNSV